MAEWKVSLASDHSILITIDARISPDIQRSVWHLAAALNYPGIRNLHPGYGTLLISFDPLVIEHAQVEELVRAASLGDAAEEHARTVEIPVCYGGDFGPDLDDVCAITGMAPQGVIETHASAEYLVYFLGFSPGFPYLGGMPESIAAPRLERPRTSVPAGSVAIGGKQTGIYSVASPGGWRIIGRTPRRLFRPDGAAPTLLTMGDHVRFVPIAAKEFADYRDPS